ncbi:MAG: hypothetical protein Q9222_007259, partial [Ikaeria aurantiellina]
MDQSVVSKAMESILNFGRTASPALQDATSTQYSSVFNSVENTQSGLQSTDAPSDQSLLLDAIDGIDVSTISQSIQSSDEPSKHQSDRQFIPRSTYFTRPLSLEPGSRTPFQFQKAVLPSFNTKPIRGPAATTGTVRKGSRASSGDPESQGFEVDLSQIITSSAGTNLEPEPESPRSHVGSGSPNDNTQQENRIQSPQISATLDHRPVDSNPIAKPSMVQPIRAGSPNGHSVRSEGHTPDRRIDGSLQTNNTVADVRDTDENDSDGDSIMMEGPTLVNVDSQSHDTAHGSSRSLSPSSIRMESTMDQPMFTGPQSPKSDPIEPQVVSRHSTDDEVMGAPKHLTDKTAADTLSGDTNTSSLSKAQEALLVALKIDMQREKQENAALRAQRQAKITEIEDLEMIITTLHENWKKAEDGQAIQKQELRKFRELAPHWKDKIKKLSDFVKGLTNDHARLRDNEARFQEQQRELHGYKEMLNRKLEETVEATHVERQYFKVQLAEAQDNMKRLEKACAASTSDLSIKCTELEAEKVVNARLQESIAKLNAYHDTILEKLSQQEDVLTSQVTALSELIRSTTANASTASHVDLKDSVEKCLFLLQQPHENDKAGLDELRRIDQWIQGHGDLLANLATSSQTVTRTVSDLRDELISDVGSRFEKLASVLEADRPLREHVVDLREIKATVTERLTSTQTNLVECRAQVSMLQAQDREQRQKISNLEAEAKTLRTLPYESTLQALRLRETEAKCVDMETRLTTHQAQLNDAETELNGKQTRNHELEANLAAAKSSLADLQSRVHGAESERNRLENQSVIDKQTIEAMSKNHDEKVRSLEHQLSEARTDLMVEEGKLVQLRVDKDNEISDKTAKIAKAQQEIEDERRRSKEFSAGNSVAQEKLLELHRKAIMDSRTISELQNAIVKLSQDKAEQEKELSQVRAELQNQMDNEILDEECDSTHDTAPGDNGTQYASLSGLIQGSQAFQTLAPSPNESQQSDMLKLLSQNLPKIGPQLSHKTSDANAPSNMSREVRSATEPSTPRTPDQPSAASLPDSQTLLVDASQSNVWTVHRSASRVESQSVTSRILTSNGQRASTSQDSQQGCLDTTQSSVDGVSTLQAAPEAPEAPKKPQSKRRKPPAQHSTKDNGGQAKRRRVDEVQKFNLGPTQTSPVHPESNLRKKVTRRSTKP